MPYAGGAGGCGARCITRRTYAIVIVQHSVYTHIYIYIIIIIPVRRHCNNNTPPGTRNNRAYGQVGMRGGEWGAIGTYLVLAIKRRRVHWFPNGSADPTARRLGSPVPCPDFGLNPHRLCRRTAPARPGPIRQRATGPRARITTVLLAITF